MSLGGYTIKYYKMSSKQENRVGKMESGMDKMLEELDKMKIILNEFSKILINPVIERIDPIEEELPIRQLELEGVIDIFSISKEEFDDIIYYAEINSNFRRT